MPGRGSPSARRTRPPSPSPPANIYSGLLQDYTITTTSHDTVIKNCCRTARVVRYKGTYRLCKLSGFSTATSKDADEQAPRKEGIFIARMTSDCKRKASNERERATLKTAKMDRGSVSKRRGAKLNGFQDFHQKAKARIWL